MLFSLCALVPEVASAATTLDGCDSTVTFTAISGSTGFNGENYPNLFDNNVQTKWCVNLGKYAQPQVVFKSSKKGEVRGYTITTANDNDPSEGRNPFSWQLYGGTSADGEWTLIDEVTNDTVLQDVNFTPFTFKIAELNATQFDHFKWVVTNVRENDWAVMQASEFKLLMVTCEHKNADGSSALGEVIRSHEATCTECAYEIHHCSVCGADVKVYTSTALAPHVLTKHDSVAATCTEPGSKEFYNCSVCENYYLDQECTIKVKYDATVIPAKGHYFRNGVCLACDTTDDRIKAFTRHGVDIGIHDRLPVFHWEYDSVANHIISTNHVRLSQSSFAFSAFADTTFQLSFDFGTQSNAEDDYLLVRIDDADFASLNNAKKSFSYVFDGKKAHDVELIYVKDDYDDNIAPCYAYVKNIVATTGIDSTKLANELFFTTEADTVAIKYGPIQLPCTLFEIGENNLSKKGGVVKIDPSMKNYEIPTLHYFFRPFAPESIEGLENFNIAKVTDMSSMFSECDLLRRLDLTSLDTKNVTDMSRMFAWCDSLSQLNIASLDTKNVTDMSSMFSGCCSLKQLDLASFDTQNVTNMSNMFSVCESLKQLDLSMFDTRNVTDMSYMFEYCASLCQIKFSPLCNTESVEDMYKMFAHCDSLSQLDLSLLRTENVKNMVEMFYECGSLKQLDLTSFDTKKVEYTYSMFDDCSSLTTIYVSDKFVLDNLEGGDDMFYNCEKLVGAVAFNSDETNSDMANYHTGYFKTYCQTGDIKHELYGDTLALDTLTLVDGELLKINAPFTAGLAIHERPLASAAASAYNRWGTICLPYAIKAPAACQLYTYGGVTYDAGTREHVIVVNEVDTLAAGTPAFFCVRDGDVASVTFSATNAAIADSLADNSADGVDGLYLQGTFNSVQVEAGYVPKDNRMWNALALNAQNNAAATNMQGLRAYLAYDPESAIVPAAEKLVFEPGVTTAVTDIETILNSGSVEIYDVNGRRSSTLQPGVNIVRQADGKAVKVLVR